MFREFSDKQMRAMSWWCPSAPGYDREAIICDGAVRSGKTVAMGLGFFLWAVTMFDGAAFALCGKSIKNLQRNVLRPVLPMLGEQGFQCRENRSRSLVTIEGLGHRNDFYIFGGMDESSAALIQGSTFAGVLFDEVALMPRSFVEQACARCSVKGARLWFNCNPEGPQHWFYREWICRAEQRRAFYLHFTMDDNPGLSPAVKEKYRRMFSGVFHKRFILGQWAAPQGLVYDFFGPQMLASPPTGQAERWVISCDYGTANPASFGLWGLYGDSWYRVEEYYYDSRREGSQKTDGEYVEALIRLAGDRHIDCVIVDPSAAAFILALGKAGFRVVKARNNVGSGIALTAQALKSGRMVICRGCADCIRELGLYRWQQDGRGDRPLKENDHAMDDMRYFAATVLEEQREEFFGMAVERTV